LDRLLLIIKDFISNEGELILLIERLDYLVAENGFSKVLDFIYRLNDVIVSSRCILLVSTNLETLSKEQKTQLVQEFKDVGGTEQIVLNEPLYELLEFIFTENNSGKRPSFKRITDRFGVTKTTTRKRVYELIDRHLVRIVEDGKFKLLEVTEHGRDVMKNPVGPRGG
jgi:DNA-binding MarR family transcriptional regulator